VQLISLPLDVILWMAIARLIVLPVIGIATRAGVIDANDEVLRLVCMYLFFSCSFVVRYMETFFLRLVWILPTATAQVSCDLCAVVLLFRLSSSP
jgi:hypothetical protein